MVTAGSPDHSAIAILCLRQARVLLDSLRRPFPTEHAAMYEYRKSGFRELGARTLGVRKTTTTMMMTMTMMLSTWAWLWPR